MRVATGLSALLFIALLLLVAVITAVCWFPAPTQGPDAWHRSQGVVKP